MSWIQVSSSNISRVRYDEKSSTLEIEFHNGRIYQYFDVPAGIFDGLTRAESKGQFFSQQIKGHFRYARV